MVGFCIWVSGLQKRLRLLLLLEMLLLLLLKLSRIYLQRIHYTFRSTIEVACCVFLQQVRTLLANQTHDINNQLRDHEESQQTQTMKLEREIKHLRQKIHEKDGTIEQMKVQQRCGKVDSFMPECKITWQSLQDFRKNVNYVKVV